MTDQEKQALLDKVSVEVKSLTGPVNTALEALKAKVEAGGTVSKEEVETVKTEMKTVNTKLVGIEETLKTQGLTLAQIQLAGGTGKVGTDKSFEEVIKANLAEVSETVNKGGQMKFSLGVDEQGNLVAAKAADTHNTATTGANQSAFESISAAANIRLANMAYDGMNTIQRDTPWILQFVTTGTTNAAAIWYTDEKAKDGDFVIKPEGDLATQLMYKFENKSTSYKTISGYIELTREWERDLAGWASEIKNLLITDLRIKLNNNILADVIASATAYTNPSLVGQIDNADDWAAIAAMYGQIGTSFGMPNVVLLNNNRVISTAATKDTTGQYVNYNSLITALNNGGLRIFNHPSIAYGDAVVGDLSNYRVRFYGGVQMEIGTVSDGFLRGKKAIVVFIDYFSYISDARKVNIVKGTLNTIKASIEKP